MSLCSLTHALKYSTSIVSHFLLQDKTIQLNKQELDARFTGLFKRLSIRGIAQACGDLYNKFDIYKDERASFYCQWLMNKMASLGVETIFEVDTNLNFVCKLQCNETENIIIAGDLMIVESYDCQVQGKEAFPYLQAYDMETLKCVWETPLTYRLMPDFPMNTSVMANTYDGEGMVQTDRDNDNSSILSVRKLITEDGVVSDDVQSFQLASSKASIL
ncbi:MAG: hypothetical protein JSR46_03565, partial [Verrucomicrobia bacterium]|nr:hypothetical protein [Verrucomicrobiota bacterium]